MNMAGNRITPTFVGTSYAEPITEIALALLPSKESALYPSGTAVAIAPNLAITAKHLLIDYWERFEGTKIENREMSGSYNLVVRQFVDQGKRAEIWAVRKIWTCSHTDVAFINLRPLNEAAVNHYWHMAVMDLVPPKVGDRISIFGYSASDAKQILAGEVKGIMWKDEPITAIGEVIEVFDERRDSVMLPFPCFITNAKVVGGMSGGPVFNESGRLCGLVCSSPTLLEDSSEQYSTIASLWPCVDTILDVDINGSGVPGKLTLYECARRNLIHIEGIDRVSLATTGDGNTVEFIDVPRV